MKGNVFPYLTLAYFSPSRNEHIGRSILAVLVYHCLTDFITCCVHLTDVFQERRGIKVSEMTSFLGRALRSIVMMKTEEFKK